jgi:hypothetical protein
LSPLSSCTCLRRPRASLLSRLAAAVALGGTLLIVGHHACDLQTTIPRTQDPDRYFTGGEIAAELEPGQWDIITDAVPWRTATDPEGRAVTVHDTVFRARRHSFRPTASAQSGDLL